MSSEKKPVVSQNSVSTESSFTDFFIHHPVFSWVVNIVIILLGITAFFQLSTRQYPKTESAIITVTSEVNGSAQTLESQITMPLEDAFASIQGLEVMTSEINPGESVTKLTFTNRTMDGVFTDVQYMLRRVEEKFPEGVQTRISKGNADAPPIMDLVVYGDKSTSLMELKDIAENTLKSSMESIPGVVNAEVLGGGGFQMDVILDPLRMSAYHVTANDIISSLKRHNLQRTVGKIKDDDREFTLITNAALKTPKEFGDIVVLKQEDSLIRLGDVSSVQVSSEEEQEHVLYNGVAAVSMNIRPGPEANPIEISQKVRQQLERIKPSLPQNITIGVVTDKSIYIKEAIRQVYSAIFEAIVLVLLVIFVFLRSASASIVPLITIPVSLVGTFFIMYMLGFTINILSLLAFVLAIGIVVDDAIVVLENIYRYIEGGMSPRQAAIVGTREIRFSIIAMTITLAAVYAPLAVVPGDVGKVFKEFALTLAGAVVISGIVALTLSPLMCADLLRPHHKEGHSPVGKQKKISGPIPLKDQVFFFLGKLSDLIENTLQKVDKGYAIGMRWAFSHRTLFLVGALCFSLFVGLLGKRMTAELSPRSDEGVMNMRLYPAPSKNLAYLIRRGKNIDDILKSQKEIAGYLLTLQTQTSSFGKMALSPWGQRKRCKDVAVDLREKMSALIGVEAFVGCSQSSIIQRSGDAQELELRLLTNDSAVSLKKIGRRLRRVLKKNPAVVHLEMNETIQAPGYNVVVDREKTSLLGIDPEEVASTFSVLVGGRHVGKFEKNNRLFPVHAWVGEKFRRSLDDLSFLSVKGYRKNQGKNEEVMVPVKELVRFVNTQGESSISRYMKKRCFDISATLDPRYSQEEVFTAFKNEVQKDLPPGYFLEPGGELARYLKESGAMYAIFALSLLFIFLVMAAQFESFISPFIILFSVPMALGGAILTLAIVPDGTLNVYSQIGFITLIGLVSKHGILLVDFANQAVKDGKDVLDAILEACRLRLRPILMTSFAMILGAIPLALASGAGSEARRQIGWVIVGGMTIGTLLTLFIVPLVYTLFTRPKKTVA